MKVSKIEIANILGLELLEFEPGSVTVVSGANGTGKTSTLEAIKLAMGGAADATLLRQGETEGRVVLVMEDGSRISRKVYQSKVGPLTVDHPAYGKVPKPAGFLAERLDTLSFNPIEFLTASEARQVEWLLEVLPVQVTDADLKAAGLELLPPPARNGLDRIEAAHKGVYDERTGINRAVKEKRGTVTQLRESLPAEEPDAIDLGALIRQRDSLQVAREAALTKTKRNTQVLLDDSREKAQKEIDRIRAEAQRQVDAINGASAKKAQAIQDEGQTAQAAVNDDYAPQLEELAGEIGAAEAVSKQAAQIEKTREMVATMEAEAKALEGESAARTVTMAALEALKERALAKLPIKGLEVKEGAIYVGTIPLRRLNRAKQVQLALNIAKLRAGDIPLVLVDGLECLDAETFKAFEAAAAKSGLQLLCSRVTEGPLTVRAGNAAAA